MPQGWQTRLNHKSKPPSCCKSTLTVSWLQRVLLCIFLLFSGAHGNQVAGRTSDLEEVTKPAKSIGCHPGADVLQVLASLASAAAAAVSKPGPGEKGDCTTFSWRFKCRRVGLSRTCLPKWVTRRFKRVCNPNSYECFIFHRSFNHVHNSSFQSDLFHMHFCYNSKTHVHTRVSFPCRWEHKSEKKEAAPVTHGLSPKS